MKMSLIIMITFYIFEEKTTHTVMDPATHICSKYTLPNQTNVLPTEKDADVLSQPGCGALTTFLP